MSKQKIKAALDASKFRRWLDTMPRGAVVDQQGGERTPLEVYLSQETGMEITIEDLSTHDEAKPFYGAVSRRDAVVPLPEWAESFQKAIDVWCRVAAATSVEFSLAIATLDNIMDGLKFHPSRYQEAIAYAMAAHQSEFLEQATAAFDDCPPPPNSGKWMLVSYPIGFDVEAAHEAGKMVLGRETIHFSAFASDPNKAVLDLIQNGLLTNIQITVRQLNRITFELTYPREAELVVGHLLDAISENDPNNLPGDGPSLTSLDWFEEYSELAREEGWDVLASVTEVRLVRVSDRFESDEAMWLYLFEMVMNTEHLQQDEQKLCRHALDYIAQNNLDEFDRMAAFVAKAMEQIEAEQPDDRQIVCRDNDEWYPQFQDLSDRD